MSCATEKAWRVVLTNSPGERLARREGDAVEEEVDPVGPFGDLAEKALDLLVGGDVAGENRRLGAEGGGQFLDVFLQPLALVIEDQFGARLMPGLRDGPGDAALVGDAENNTGFTGQRKMTHGPTMMPAREKRGIIDASVKCAGGTVPD
jgi:hypothetical protein